MNNSADVLAALYQEDLYSLPPRTVVVIPEPWEKMSETDVDLLAKILASVKTSLTAVSVLSAETVQPDDLKALNLKYLLLFGSQSVPAVAPYTSATVGTVSVIRADRLSELDDVKKKNLWMALKATFAR